MESIYQLPDEVLLDIISFMNPCLQFIMRLVCKRFRDLKIATPDRFLNAYLSCISDDGKINIPLLGLLNTIRAMNYKDIKFIRRRLALTGCLEGLHYFQFNVPTEFGARKPFSRETDFAAFGGHAECLKYLIQKKMDCDWITVQMAIMSNSLECIKVIYEFCNDDSPRCSTLHYLAEVRGNPEIINYMRENIFRDL